MNYIYVLYQKEKNRVKVGKTTYPYRRIETLKETWGDFDNDSYILEIDIKKCNQSLSIIEKTIHNVLIRKNLSYTHEKEEDLLKDGYSEFFTLDKKLITRTINFIYKEFIINKTFINKIKSKYGVSLFDKEKSIRSLISKRQKETFKNKKLIDNNEYVIETDNNYFYFHNYKKNMKHLSEIKTVEFTLNEDNDSYQVNINLNKENRMKYSIELLFFSLLDFKSYSKKYIQQNEHKLIFNYRNDTNLTFYIRKEKEFQSFIEEVFFEDLHKRYSLLNIHE